MPAELTIRSGDFILNGRRRAKTDTATNWGFVYHLNHSRVKVSDQLVFIIRLTIAAPQCSISQLRGAGNITEAPPVADEAR